MTLFWDYNLYAIEWGYCKKKIKEIAGQLQLLKQASVAMQTALLESKIMYLYGWADCKVEDIRFDLIEVSEGKLAPFSRFERMVVTKKGERAFVYEEECKKRLSLLFPNGDYKKTAPLCEGKI